MKKDYYSNILEQIANPNLDISRRDIKNRHNIINVLYIKQLTDLKILSENIIQPITTYILEYGEIITTKSLYDGIVQSYSCFIDRAEEKITEYILKGNVVMLLSNDVEYLVIKAKKVAKRPISEPQLQYSLRGPRDTFNENLDDNLSLIRQKIKDPSLNINKIEIGTRTKTDVAVLYLGDVVNDDFVTDIMKRLNDINVDGIIDSGELKHLLYKKSKLFPKMGIIERSDMACGALLEGKIVIIVDGSTLALVAPKLFTEFFASCDDFYDNKYTAFFYLNLRLIAAFISFTITPIYIAIFSFHIDTIPAEYIIIISESMEGVPFNILLGALIVEFIVEMMREALLRVPKQVGSAVAIIGGIIIGQAAIAARIFNPLLLIVASVSLLASFTAPDYTVTNPLRIGKYVLLIACGMFGFVGFTLVFSIILIEIISTNSLGVPYLAPIAPFDKTDFKNTFLQNKFDSPRRPNFLKTKNPTTTANNS